MIETDRIKVAKQKHSPLRGRNHHLFDMRVEDPGSARTAYHLPFLKNWMSIKEIS